MRWACDILYDMREAHKVHNYSYLLSLIEEMQYAANRMESAISDLGAIEKNKEELHNLKKEVKKLKKKKKNN